VSTGTVADHPYPSLTRNYHYEAELVAAIGGGGRNIPVAMALDHVYGYSLGLDMTRRDLQRAMGDEKKPWEIGKSGERGSRRARRRHRDAHRRAAEPERQDGLSRGLGALAKSAA
jgi:2-keto-4-pentenoate hydratase/2-oxohepta-3-ene-1,7-dioic acid hydratase in catechol pathway